MSSLPVPSPERLSELAGGFVEAEILLAAVELGVVDLLHAAAPKTATEVAKQLDVDPTALYRLMRALCSLGVLDELESSGFALSAAGNTLASDEALRSQVLFGSLSYRAFGMLSESVRTGQNAFELAYGESFFSYLSSRPLVAGAFQDLMTTRSIREAKSVVNGYDFSTFRAVVDVGGGRGALLDAILEKNPDISATLFEVGSVINEVRKRDTCRYRAVAGDFFEAVPNGADAYVLSRILHDWNDGAATLILEQCRRAMSMHSRLLVVEALLPKRAVDGPAVIRMDLGMLTMVGGQERTAEDFKSLMSAAGLVLSSVTSLDQAIGLHVLEAVRAE